MNSIRNSTATSSNWVRRMIVSSLLVAAIVALSGFLLRISSESSEQVTARDTASSAEAEDLSNTARLFAAQQVASRGAIVTSISALREPGSVSAAETNTNTVCPQGVLTTVVLYGSFPHDVIFGDVLASPADNKIVGLKGILNSQGGVCKVSFLTPGATPDPRAVNVPLDPAS